MNKSGGILGRSPLIVGEGPTPKDTVDATASSIPRQVEVVIGGISTGVTSHSAVAEEWKCRAPPGWHDPEGRGRDHANPMAFKSVDNEVEAIVAVQLTPKYFKGVRDLAGINNDYSYGHDCWEPTSRCLKKCA